MLNQQISQEVQRYQFHHTDYLFRCILKRVFCLIIVKNVAWSNVPMLPKPPAAQLELIQNLSKFNFYIISQSVKRFFLKSLNAKFFSKLLLSLFFAMHAFAVPPRQKYYLKALINFAYISCPKSLVKSWQYVCT